jgi:hypothetical protein
LSRRKRPGERKGVWLLLPILALAGVFGCGGTVLSLTGGSVPIGTSRLQGIVVRADNVARPVAGALLTLRRGSNSSQIAADSQGHFDFGPIAGGDMDCAIQPLPGQGLRTGWDWYFHLPENTGAQLIAALPTYAQDLTAVDHVTLSPTQTVLQRGDWTRFIATAYDHNNAALPLTPSLLLRGDVGTLYADGAFQATKPGSASITAWVNGKEVTAQITVQP